MKNPTGSLISGIVAMVFLGLVGMPASAQTCISTTGSPNICAAWTQGGNPTHLTDFVLDFSTPGVPNIALKSGSSWTLYSHVVGQPNTPAPLGAVTLDLDSMHLDDDFTVTLANGGNPGVSSLGSVILTDVGHTGHSNLSGEVDGNVTGDLLVVKDSGGAGGAIDALDISGDLCGDVTAASIDVMNVDGNVDGSFDVEDEINGLTIGGDLEGSIAADELYSSEITGDLLGDGGGLGANVGTTAEFEVDGVVSGDVTIGTLFEGDIRVGTLSADLTISTAIDGNEGQAPTVLWFETVSAGATVSVADMIGTASPSGVVIVQVSNTFSGTLELLNGIPELTSVDFWDSVTSTAQVDLDNEDVAGTLTFEAGCSICSVINGGDVTATGLVELTTAFDANSTFSGDATFANVAGNIKALGNGDVSGTLHLTGNLSGTVQITGELASGGLLDIDGSTSGTITVEDGGAGDITGAALTGTVTVADGSSSLYSGDAIFSSMSSSAQILATNGADLDGLIKLTGSMTSSSAKISTDELKSGGVIQVVGNLDGLIEAGHTYGDIKVDGDTSSSSEILVKQALQGTGRVLVAGLCDGEIDINGATMTNSLIRCLDGLDDNGKIIVNSTEGNNNANGSITIGLCDFSPLGAVVYDGCILIQDNGSGSDGDLGSTGSITVCGCHSTTDDLDICVDGGVDGRITVSQSGCGNSVSHSCVGACE